MCGVPLQSAPGEVLRYSNVGIGIAARALESVTGQSVHENIRGVLLQPLGIEEIALTPGPEMDSSIAWVHDAANSGTPVESYNSPYWRSLGIPWGGYFGSAEALARFATSFLPGSASPLDGATRGEMIVDQTGGLPGGVGSAGIHWNRVPGDSDGRSRPTSAITGQGRCVRLARFVTGVSPERWFGPIPSENSSGGFRQSRRSFTVAIEAGPLGATQ
jgi:CubicO group peptidase (beta-lactamase class C family)